MTVVAEATVVATETTTATAQDSVEGELRNSVWETVVDSNGDVNVQVDSLSFDQRGLSPRCWNVTEQVSDQIYPADSASFKDCTTITWLTVQVQDAPSIQWTDQGWQVSQTQQVRIAIRGTSNETGWSDFQAAIVVQLCPLDISSPCVPLVPPPPQDSGFSMATTTTTDTYKEQLGTLFNFKYIPIQIDGSFAGQLSLSNAPQGKYSLLGSMILFGPNLSLEGASIVPLASSKEQILTISNKDVPVYTNTETSPTTVQDWAVNLVIALSTIGGIVVVTLLVGVIYHRNAQVFQLTQGKFIIAMSLSGLVATCSLVLLEPKNDLYCHLYQTFITLPIHIMFAILVGRMWRIRAIISPLLLLTLDKKEHWTTKWVNMVERMTRIEGLGKRVEARDKKIRISITDGQLMRVITMLCLPQVIIQILILTILDQSHEIDSFPNNDDTYHTCKYTYFNNALGIVALTLVLALFIILMVLARASRDLPSLFNETRSMLDVALVAFRMSFAGALLIAATHTFPSAITSQYLVIASLAGVTVVHTCFRIIWPKFVVANSGKKILVTKLISAHNDLTRSQTHSFTSSGGPALLDHYYKNSFYGGSSMTGINIPKSQDHPILISSLTGQSIFPSAILDSHSTPRSSDGLQKGNLETLQEEERESSDNSLGHVEEDSQKIETVENSGDASEANGNDDDLNSTSSSVIITEESIEPPQLARGQTIYSTETIDRTRHYRLSHAFSNRSINSAAPSNTNTAPSRASTESQSSFSFARTSSLTSMTGDRQLKNTRVLSRRALFQHQSSAMQLTDVENRLSAVQPSETTVSGVVDATLPQNNTNNDNNRNTRKRERRGAGSRDRINNAGQKMLSLWGNRGGVVKSEAPRRCTSSSGRIQSTVPLTIEYNPKHISDTILVAENQTPPRRLLLRMIDVQRMLFKLNQAILIGLCVKTEDWEEIRDACVALGDVFLREVEFEWERYRDGGMGTPSIVDSGEMKSDDNFPSDSAVAPANTTHLARQELAKQISWKEGLIGTSSDSQLEGGVTRPSILRNRETQQAAVVVIEPFKTDLSPILEIETGTKIDHKPQKGNAKAPAESGAPGIFKDP